MNIQRKEESSSCNKTRIPMNLLVKSYGSINLNWTLPNFNKEPQNRKNSLRASRIVMMWFWWRTTIRTVISRLQGPQTAMRKRPRATKKCLMNTVYRPCGIFEVMTPRKEIQNKRRMVDCTIICNDLQPTSFTTKHKCQVPVDKDIKSEWDTCRIRKKALTIFE